MKFGRLALARAEGSVLAHSMQGALGRVAKGSVLTRELLDQLAAAGHEDLVVATLGAGDIEENAAARALAHALVPEPEAQGLRVTGAGAGRVNVYATGAGVAVIDSAAVADLNAVDPMITLATLAPYTRVDAGTMVGTIKIISYAVPETALDAACDAALRCVHVAPAAYRQATLVETQVGGEEPAPKGRRATEERLSRLGLELSPRIVVDHDSAAISEAIAHAPGEVVLILTASATSDPSDVAPQALRDAGGHVEAYGMPVDPGNLLFFGTLGDKPVIGLPGCARSPALNGADWVLERLVCGIKLTQSDIQSMGVGGLLKEIPTRPRPRALRG